MTNKLSAATELNAVYLTDYNNIVTGFITQFPEVVSQGETIEEVERNLFNILPDIIEIKDEIMEEDFKDMGTRVERRSYPLQMA